MLKGSIRTLVKFHPPVLVEFNKSLSQLAHQSLFDMYSLMIQNAYEAFVLEKGKLKKVEKEYMKQITLKNILFL